MTIQWYSTTKDKAWELRNVDHGQAERANLTVTEVTAQEVRHFGGCFNELGFEALSKLPQEKQDQLMYDLFHPEGDHKFTMCRLPIGASDYAMEWYSLNEVENDFSMEHFSIERDKKFLIPYIKKALVQNPDLKCFASPWSPPTWMKSPKAYNYGTLRWEEDILHAYALYFVKFIQAYEKEGIIIDHIHVQNEVVADQKFPSCVWSGEQLKVFIRDYLGPAFEKYKIKTGIWLGTINAPEPLDELIHKKTSDYDVYANLVLSDPEAYKYIQGVGYQWAGKYALQRTVQSYPELNYSQTENECGDGKNSWDYARYVFNLYHHYFSNGVNNYFYWNMILEPNGESTWGWKQNSMLTIDPVKQEYKPNPEYYVMKHFSHVIQPGAKRLMLTGPWTGNALAFVNPDGEIVVIISNPFQDTRPLHLMIENRPYQFELKAESFNTIVYKGL
ncbi:glycoside hydrolase family 30 protein [Amphibacillus cookii]|uniref:glycoside hydrolase family 30 protein n=1 Tax=Amphibacillus cookii TaxID=767787 RepID=UPI001958C652|nr:glycoside hydrolase family 30 protein [Amphibacillus cookii]MBM7541112.1 glucosylceramidase [Amphibacillus cookii]